MNSKQKAGHKRAAEIIEEMRKMGATQEQLKVLRALLDKPVPNLPEAKK